MLKAMIERGRQRLIALLDRLIDSNQREMDKLAAQIKDYDNQRPAQRPPP